MAGIWIALEDCTVENGCLSFIPGTHKGILYTNILVCLLEYLLKFVFYFLIKQGPLDVRFIRNPNKEEFDNGKYLIYTKDSPKYDPSSFVSVPVKAG